MIAARTVDAVERTGVPQIKKMLTANRTDYPREKTISQLFEEIAAQYPRKMAVVSGPRKLTYADLNARANYLAVELRRLGVGPETMVGCCIERSSEMIVAFVAILKAGAAYVPLDPAYPKERFEYLLEDTGMQVLLTEKKLAATFDKAGARILCVDECEAPSAVLDAGNPSSSGTAKNLAYVMYTSGSTGQPKGVMVENRAVVRLVRNTNFCKFGPEEVFLQFAPVSFDASILEIWGALLNGGTLVLMPPQAASLEDIGRAIREHGVTTIWLTSGLFNLMVEQRLEDLRPIRQLLAGGDVLSARHVRRVLEALPDCTLINGYGPTENTTFTCCHVMRPGDRIPESVPIGQPISNTFVYILDEDLNPAAPGVQGELYAGGDGVARGYLNDPARTAEKFLPDPFSGEPNARMYRTGDLARWGNDGVVEFLGRVDSQVKINGYRIEPGEIETVLRAYEGINQAYVVPHTDETGSKRLVAYFTSAQNGEPSSVSLKQFLSRKIPVLYDPSGIRSARAPPALSERKNRPGCLAGACIRKRDILTCEERGNRPRATNHRCLEADSACGMRRIGRQLF